MSAPEPSLPFLFTKSMKTKKEKRVKGKKIKKKGKKEKGDRQKPPPSLFLSDPGSAYHRRRKGGQEKKGFEQGKG